MRKKDYEKPKYLMRLEEFIEEHGYIPRLFCAYNKKAYSDYVPCITANCYPSGKSSVMVVEVEEESPS